MQMKSGNGRSDLVSGCIDESLLSLKGLLNLLQEWVQLIDDGLQFQGRLSDENSWLEEKPHLG